jgi:hypothetical protein
MGPLAIAAFALLAIGGLVATIGHILIMIAAFKVSTGWGLAVLFLPLASLVFMATNWQAAKRGFQVLLIGILLSAGGGVVVVQAGVLTAKSMMQDMEEAAAISDGQLPAAEGEDNANAAADSDADAAEMETDPLADEIPLEDDPLAYGTVIDQPDAGDPMNFVGRTIAELRAERGSPRVMGRGRGKKVLLMYDDFEYEADDGVTITTQKEAEF